MDRKTEYQNFSLSSGRSVDIRPRSYEEWEAQEDARLAAVESIPSLLEADKRPAAEALLQRAYRDARSARLAAWVRDWPAQKGALNLRDIAEIEKAAQALEEPEVLAGNSRAGGDGQ